MCLLVRIIASCWADKFFVCIVAVQEKMSGLMSCRSSRMAMPQPPSSPCRTALKIRSQAAARQRLGVQARATPQKNRRFTRKPDSALKADLDLTGLQKKIDPPPAHTPSFFCFSLPPALSPMCTRTTSIHKHVRTAECRDKEHGGQGSVRCGHGFEANGRGAACQKASRWGTRRAQRQYRAWGHSVEGKQSPCVAASPGSCARGWYLDMLS